MAGNTRLILTLCAATTALRVPRPQLRVAGRARAMMNPRGPQIPYALRTSHATLYATDAAAAAVEPEPQQRGLKAILQSPETKKVVPLALIFFCILFNYTILRDTKDVLVVTAPKSGAEIIPFLKTYVNLPGAIAFTVLYGSLSNRFSQPQVFRGVVSTFLGFFAAFAWVLYPNIGSLHPHGLADAAAKILPGSFQAPIAVIRNWTFSLFYLAAELWGSVVASLLFWGFANSVVSVNEAKKYYPLFGLFANVALVFSGQFVRIVSKLRAGAADPAAAWGLSLKLLMGGVVASGGVLLGAYEYMQRQVVTDPRCVDPSTLKKSKTKTKMSMRDSAKYLAQSKYIRDLATLVIGYGMAINIVEVTWKANLKRRFPDPAAYSAFMGAFSSTTGGVTLFMMLAGQRILKKFGWGVAAAVTPVTLLATGCVFFSLVLKPGVWAPLCGALGTTPLMLAVLVGAAQNIASKSTKYALFDPCKEMAYIPLDAEQKTKGKAAVDVIGNPLGKSGGALVQQMLILSLGSLAACTPYLATILFGVIFLWLRAARSLAGQFEAKMASE
jgi:AAA family ATP:ADP antiporter